MAAPLDGEARLDGRAHDAAEIDAGDRAPRARRLAPVQGQRESGPLEALLQARRDQPDDAGRPALARHDHRRAALLQPEREQSLGFGLGEHRQFDLLARAIEAVELGGDCARLQFVARRQQPRAERGIADAAARIDARADEKAEMIGARRPVGARRVEQGGQARALALAHHGEAARDERAVEADERHDVGDRRQRDEIERGQEIGRGAARRKNPASRNARLSATRPM